MDARDVPHRIAGGRSWDSPSQLRTPPAAPAPTSEALNWRVRRRLWTIEPHGSWFATCVGVLQGFRQAGRHPRPGRHSLSRCTHRRSARRHGKNTKRPDKRRALDTEFEAGNGSLVAANPNDRMTGNKLKFRETFNAVWSDRAARGRAREGSG